MSARRKTGRPTGTRRAQTEPAQVARARRARRVPIDAEALFEVVHEPLLVLDAELRVERANSPFCRTFEIAATEIEGHLLAEADHGAWNVSELRGLLEQALGNSLSGEPLELRHTFERIGRRVLRIRVQRSRGRGGLDQILLAMEDLTERELVRAGEQQAAERLWQIGSLIESSNDAIIGKALDGTIISWNRGAEDLFGYTAAEAIGRSITLICPDDRIGDIERFIEQIRRGERVPTFETRRLRKDGRQI